MRTLTLQRGLLKSSILAAHVVVNRWAWVRLAVGRVSSSNGSTHSAWPVDRSVRYIERVFGEYDRWVEPGAWRGRRILEIGPGDNLGVALKFLAAGAAQVVALDKFYSNRDPRQERRIYLALRQRLNSQERLAFDAAVDLGEEVKFDRTRLVYSYGQGIEEAEAVLGAARFDAIVSRAVLEELDDLDSVFAALDRLLAPGGVQIHRVDLRDYGTLSRHGYHPLEFLTVPDKVYRYASKYSRPNRMRIDYYRRKADGCGYDASFRITRVCGLAEELDPPKPALEIGVDYTSEALAQIEAIRPRLLPRFRELPAADLLPLGFLMIARKPS
jgi:SAM-dependent methyltransferase